MAFEYEYMPPLYTAIGAAKKELSYLKFELLTFQYHWTRLNPQTVDEANNDIVHARKLLYDYRVENLKKKFGGMSRW